MVNLSPVRVLLKKVLQAVPLPQVLQVLLPAAVLRAVPAVVPSLLQVQAAVRVDLPAVTDK